jgi:4-hydroxy-3-polyprenylbenzoate decarboxylase
VDLVKKIYLVTYIKAVNDTMHLIVAITGCSGVAYGVRLLEACKKLGIETDLIVSQTAEKLLELELGKNIKDISKLAKRNYSQDDLEAPLASGSVKTDGMVIAPCSMKTLGAIASGIADNLITRAADVTLKEGRPLVLVPRETPLNLIHLENMVKLRLAGATILPAMPGFYHKPKEISELIDFIVGRILDVLGVEHKLYRRWQGSKR